MPDTETTYFAAELLAGAQDFRPGWTTADGRVVVVMSPENADAIARLIVQSTRAAEDQLTEHRWIHAAIGLITAAAHADLPTQPDMQIVPKVDLPPTAAGLDARDQANVTPKPSRFVDCVCGDRHPYDGRAFDVPADGRMHGLVEP